MIDVNNVDFNAQSQGKWKLVSGPLRYRINIAGIVEPVNSRHIFHGRVLADEYRLTSFLGVIRSEKRQEAVRVPLKIQLLTISDLNCVAKTVVAIWTTDQNSRGFISSS